MSIETQKGILIFLIIPLIGIFSYMWLASRMAFSKMKDPPYGSYFVVFAGYGGLLVIALTWLMVGWSCGLGLMLMGAMTIGLVAIVSVEIVNGQVKEPTGYHRWVVYLCVGYGFCVFVLWEIMK